MGILRTRLLVCRGVRTITPSGLCWTAFSIRKIEAALESTTRRSYKYRAFHLTACSPHCFFLYPLRAPRTSALPSTSFKFRGPGAPSLSGWHFPLERAATTRGSRSGIYDAPKVMNLGSGSHQFPYPLEQILMPCFCLCYIYFLRRGRDRAMSEPTSRSTDERYREHSH